MKHTTLALALAGLCAGQDTSASLQRQVAERCDQLELMFEANPGGLPPSHAEGLSSRRWSP